MRRAWRALIVSGLRAAVVISLMAASLVVLAGRALSAQTGKTIWDGVYTVGQATRGEAGYQKECASCHQGDLQGDGFAPALIADAFTLRWQDSSVGDLLTVVKLTMPQDRPSTLGDEAYADIVAYLLKTNRYPAGPEELSKEPADLKQITFKERGPAKPD
jgi:mono/diheme cytochrome c family protein